MKIQGKRCDKWFAQATSYDVLSLGILMEQGAVKTYQAMAQQAPSPVLKAKFRYLAAEEREHARILTEVRKRHKRPAQSLPLPVTAGEADGIIQAPSLNNALRRAQDAECDAEAFYRKCADRCRRAKGRKMFEALATQEARHAKILQDELKALQGPLPWSSLEGFIPEEKDFWSA